MDIVKDINKLIIKKVIEIVFVISFVFSYVYLWKNNSLQASIATFNNLSYTNFTIENSIDYSMYPMTDEDAMKSLSPCYITVSNETYTMEGYALALIVDKTSTLDYHFLNISVNDKVYSLNDLEQIDHYKEITFILAKDSIVGDMKTYTIRLWLNTLAGNDMQAKELSIRFDLLKETMKI